MSTSTSPLTTDVLYEQLGLKPWRKWALKQINARSLGANTLDHMLRGTGKTTFETVNALCKYILRGKPIVVLTAELDQFKYIQHLVEGFCKQLKIKVPKMVFVRPGKEVPEEHIILDNMGKTYE